MVWLRGCASPAKFLRSRRLHGKPSYLQPSMANRGIRFGSQPNAALGTFLSLRRPTKVVATFETVSGAVAKPLPRQEYGKNTYPEHRIRKHIDRLDHRIEWPVTGSALIAWDTEQVGKSMHQIDSLLKDQTA